MDERIENPEADIRPARGAMLPAALGLGILWQNVFTIEGLAALVFDSRPGPALGAAVFTAAIWAFVLLFLGKRARWDRYSIGLAAGVGLLTAFCVLGGCGDVRFVNFILIFCGSVLAFFSLSGRSAAALSDARCVGEAVRLFFRAIFANWDKPFRALGGMKEGRQGPVCAPGRGGGAAGARGGDTALCRGGPGVRGLFHRHSGLVFRARGHGEGDARHLHTLFQLLLFLGAVLRR